VGEGSAVTTNLTTVSFLSTLEPALATIPSHRVVANCSACNSLGCRSASRALTVVDYRPPGPALLGSCLCYRCSSCPAPRYYTAAERTAGVSLQAFTTQVARRAALRPTVPRGWS
jgi:hypothetical protein